MNEKTEARLRRARKSRMRMRKERCDPPYCVSHTPSYLRPGDFS